MVTINFDNETDIEDVRRLLEYYEQYTNDISEKAGGLFKVDDYTAYGYSEWRKGNQEGARDVLSDSYISGRIGDGRGTYSEIRRSRRVVNQEELKRSIDNAVEMLIVAGDFNPEEYNVSAPFAVKKSTLRFIYSET